MLNKHKLCIYKLYLIVICYNDQSTCLPINPKIHLNLRMRFYYLPLDKTSSKDIYDSTRSVNSSRSTTVLNFSNQSYQKPYFGGFALSTKNESCETCHKMEYINLASHWPPSLYQKYDQRF